MIKEQEVLDKFFISENKKLNKIVKLQEEMLLKLTGAVEDLALVVKEISKNLGDNYDNINNKKK
jgi:hypothetical protein